MTNAELLAKIKAEIDKRYVEYREKMKTDDFTYYEGMADALDLFEQFLDTLESEKPVPADLEKAAEQYAEGPECTWVGTTALEYAFIAGAKWQKEQDKTLIKEAHDFGFGAGSEWQKEQMINEAILMYRCYDNEHKLVGFSSDYEAKGAYGNFVHIIIVKEEEK